MTVPRFFVDDELAAGREVALPERIRHHAIKVLRLRQDAVITVFNGRGGEYTAELQRAGTAKLLHHDPVDRESPLDVTLVQSWVVNTKLDFIAEKAVELGVTRLLIVPSARSVARLAGDRLRARIDHLRDVAISACCQSGRTRVPSVGAAGSLQDGLEEAARGATGLVLSPGAAASLRVAVGGANPVTIAIGPEGGFDDDELALALRLGYRVAHLGPRILRTETAGVAALAQLQAQFGDAQ